MENLKDVATTICGLLFVICGAVLGVETQISLPKWTITLAIVLMAISGAVSMYLTGKNPNGTAKTQEQVVALNSNK